MRILIAGSRDWEHAEVIRGEMIKYDIHRLKRKMYANEVTLVSGACPTGADAIAEEFAERLGWTIERHPADWEGLGKKAGPLRNQDMVDLGADVCLGFILNESRGASGCVRMAQKANIPTIVWRRDVSDLDIYIIRDGGGSVLYRGILEGGTS